MSEKGSEVYLEIYIEKYIIVSLINANIYNILVQKGEALIVSPLFL
jgi:hypothetical protein